MKQCPACNRTYTDDALSFCLEDGTPLVSAGGGDDASSSFDPSATLAFTPARETNPPPSNVYSPGQTPTPAPSRSPPPPPPAYTPMPQTARSKPSATPWIIGGIAAVVVLGIGIVVLLSIIGSESKERNKNAGVVNRSTSNSIKIPGTTLTTTLRDDFSVQNWPTGESAYGSYYKDGQYHMKAKPDLYVYMFPRITTNYVSKDATVKVTVRSVSGTSPEYGYGLIMHGKVGSKGNLEGYGFFIYSGATPGYQIVQFKEGEPEALVKWTNSSVIRTGTSPNQIEVRARGSQLNMYVNGQFLKGVTDTSNITDGFVGLYSSETPEVAFDDLEIDRGASASTP